MNILPYNRAASDTAEAHPSPKAPTNSNGIDREGPGMSTEQEQKETYLEFFRMRFDSLVKGVERWHIGKNSR